MKKIYRLLMSVVAMAAVVSCTTDATEDLGVKVGGKTQLTLSLDNSRTQLGEKADGVYPLTWSENDQVSVNGVASDELTVAEGAGTANATFTFGGELKTPYCIAYPATAEGQVQLAAMQLHTAQATFANNAAAMYGYSANGENIQLKHLTGVLKFTIAATEEFVDFTDAPKLNKITISTIDRKPIAGAFNIDFATGKLTPTEESTTLITYAFDKEPLFTGTSVDVYITVPAGEYDELYVTVEDMEGNVVYKTVKADSNLPLLAGKVREFSTPIVFEPINTEEVFVIKDYDSLLAFGEYAATGTSAAPVTKDAVFVADVDMTDKSWTSVGAQYYTGTIHGNGYVVNGLTKRLFVTLGATVKGLHLTNVNYSSKNGACTNVSSLAGIYYGPCLTHCSTSGTLTLKDVNGDDALRMGGIVATVSSKMDTEISNCVNRCNLVVNFTTVGGAGAWTTMGGVYGTTIDATGVLTLKNCVNEGTITVTGKGYLPSRTGGVVGYMAAYGETHMSNCVNKGKITFSVATLQGSSRTTYVGGLIADLLPGSNGYTIKNCRNEAEVIVNSSNMNRHLFFGGLIGYAKCTKAAGLVVENCANTAAITADIDACKPTNADPYANCVSAIIGRLESTVTTSITVKDVVNSGKLSYAGCNVLTNSASNTSTKCEANTHTYINVGGVIGKLIEAVDTTPTYTFSGWTNTGDIEVTIGKEGLNAENSFFGGFIGNKNSGTVAVSDAKFYATMTVSKLNEDETYTTYANAGLLTGDVCGVFTNSAVGGTFVCGDGTATLSTTPITADNLVKYLSNNREQASYDGVSLLTSKPL